MDQRIDGSNGTGAQDHLAQARAGAQQYSSHYPGLEIDAIETYLALVQVNEELSQAYARFVGAPGENLSRTRVGVLRLLYFSDERRLPLSELARLMSFTSTNATRLIDGLAREGWVERVASATDRRVTYAQLTAEGLQRCETLFPTIARYMAAITAGLTSDEREDFQRLLAKIGATALRLEPLAAEPSSAGG